MTDQFVTKEDCKEQHKEENYVYEDICKLKMKEVDKMREKLDKLYTTTICMLAMLVFNLIVMYVKSS